MGNRTDSQGIYELVEKYRNAKFLHNGRSLDEGIDCLGFIILFYRDLGVNLPNDDGKPIEEDWFKTNPNRYIRAIKNLGYKEVRFRDLRPLDMVYFAISRNIITHTGIMISKREFAHMSPNKNFLISKLERGWLSRARGAVRVIE
ncbi:MAG TPA: NlpC/P60 family protein [Clostridia bacterium]|nr:NlpC/P60 family protein [Clostridia bacterium]